MDRLPILTGLAPQRIAVVLPVCSYRLWPGQVDYEWLLEDVRESPRADVFGLLLPFGIVPERSLIENPELVRVERFEEVPARREACVRIRAWLDLQGPYYERFVLLPYGEVMPTWSRAVEGHPVASRVHLLPVHKGRWRDTVLKRGLSKQVVGR